MNFAIRIANAADIPAMLRVINAAFSIETFLEGTRADNARLRAMMETGTFFVAELNGEVAASIYVELRGERCTVAMLAVDPKKQGSALARAIVQQAEQYCRERGC